VQAALPLKPIHALEILERSLTALPMGWLLGTPCPLCQQLPPLAEPPTGGLCRTCADRLSLPPGGLRGLAPLPWWGIGSYGGALRGLLLDLKHRPRPDLVAALLKPLQPSLRSLAGDQGSLPPLLVPIPSWKRRGNPLPALICSGLGKQLGLRRADLLTRSHPVLGQHHLGRRLRLANQDGAFRCQPPAERLRRRPILIVDDILTTGATALNGALCLKAAGWPVLGLVCLARTAPRPGAKGAVI
jgi:predicted amidophosphoribosyltransferase